MDRPHSSLWRPARLRRALIMLLAIPAFAGQAAPSPVPCDSRDPGTKKPGTLSYDVVLANGRVIDPETNLDEEGYHVGIIGDRIAAVSPTELDCKEKDGCRCIDVEGRVIAPGFIDLHAHGMHVFAMRVQAFDGVTTALELESGVLPIERFYKDRENGQPINYGAAAAWTFARIAAMHPEFGEPDGMLGYFARAQGVRRWKVYPARSEQLEEILRRLKEALDQGALGIGMNAGYAPGYGTDEAKEIHELASDEGVRTFYHLRGTRVEPPGSAMESVEELVDLAAATGSQIHIHHINSSMRCKVSEVGEIILEARRKGLDISTEAYPYGASSTVIGAFDDYDRLNSEGYDWRSFDYLGEPFESELDYFSLRDRQPDVPIVWHFFNTEKREEWGPPVCGQYQEGQDHAALFEALSFPDTAIASDGMPWTYLCKEDEKNKEDGCEDEKDEVLLRCSMQCNPMKLMVEADDNAWPFKPTNDYTIFAHPRSAGTFSRILSEYVSWDLRRRSDKFLPLEAIRKLTLIPAQILEKSVAQMSNKGRLQVGKDADVVVFDPGEVEERATFKAKSGSSWDRQSVGMEYVLVNGVLLIDQGEMQTGVMPGRPIRRVVDTE